MPRDFDRDKQFKGDDKLDDGWADRKLQEQRAEQYAKHKRELEPPPNARLEELKKRLGVKEIAVGAMSLLQGQALLGRPHHVVRKPKPGPTVESVAALVQAIEDHLRGTGDARLSDEQYEEAMLQFHAEMAELEAAPQRERERALAAAPASRALIDELLREIAGGEPSQLAAEARRKAADGDQDQTAPRRMYRGGSAAQTKHNEMFDEYRRLMFNGEYAKAAELGAIMQETLGPPMVRGTPSPADVKNREMFDEYQRLRSNGAHAKAAELGAIMLETLGPPRVRGTPSPADAKKREMFDEYQRLRSNGEHAKAEELSAMLQQALAPEIARVQARIASSKAAEARSWDKQKRWMHDEPPLQQAGNAISDPKPAALLPHAATPMMPPLGRAMPVAAHVQMKAADADSAISAADVREAAALGASGSGHALPFLDQLQKAFGRDLTDIKAHTDSTAAAGATAMGAKAYATGNDVVFGDNPDLHTVAHEVAHVLQQRDGVSLSSGVGAVGDDYERSADAIADRVVAGQSAVDLLPGGKAAATGIKQLQAMLRADDQPKVSAVSALLADFPTERDAMMLEIHSNVSPKFMASLEKIEGPRETPVALHLMEGKAVGGSSSNLLPADAGAMSVEVKTDAVQMKEAPSAVARPKKRKPKQTDGNPTSDATFDDVRSAAATSDKDRLDIAWIDALPAFVKDSIDLNFSVSTQNSNQQVATKGIEKKYAAAKKVLVAQTQKRLRKNKQSATIEAVSADVEYQAAELQLEQQRQASLAAAIKSVDDQVRNRGEVGESIADAPQGAATQVQWKEGRAASRANFMSFAVETFGNAAAAKTHFQSIREVAKAGGMWLTDAAATRFEKARADFESKFTGYTFPHTDVGYATRGRHQSRQGIGMMGHLLGIAFDLWAIQNPHQITNEERFLLGHFGAEQGGGKKGRTMMNLDSVGGDQAVEDLGINTVAGRSTNKGKAVEALVRQQFDEMTATSDRFRAHLAGSLPGLQAAVVDSVEAHNLRDQAVALAKQKELAAAIRAAAKDFPYPKFPKDMPKQDIAAEKKRIDELRLEAVARALPGIGKDYRDLNTAANDKDAASQGEIKKALDPLTLELDGLQAAVKQRSQDADRASAPSTAAIAKVKQSLQGKPRWSTLAALRQANEATFTNVPVMDAASGADPATYRQLLLDRLETLQKARNDIDEIAFLERIKQRIIMPEYAIGKIERNKKTHAWEAVDDVKSPSVRQYAEKGFIANNPMPTGGQSPKMTRQVFNREVMATLVRFGFSPGSTYGDTMHFDFIGGDNAIPGQRTKNMGHDQFGPEGKMNP
jgi:hypothetical protein